MTISHVGTVTPFAARLRSTLAAGGIALVALATAGSAAAQDAPGISGSTVLLAGDIARLELDLASGASWSIELNTGHVLIDGERAGEYELGGALDRAWRELLRSPAIGETAGLPKLLSDWTPSVEAEDAAGTRAIIEALDRFDPAAAVLAGDATGNASDVAAEAGRVTIVPRAGSIGQLAERLHELNDALDRIAGEEFQIDGDFALVVHDDYHVAEGTTVSGDVAVLGGRLTVEGNIEGDVLVLGGDLLLEPGAVVAGDVRSMGGEVVTTGATVAGEILALSQIERSIDEAVNRAVESRAEAEWDRARDRADRTDYGRDRGRGFFGSIGHNIGHTISDIIGTVGWAIALTLVGALLVYLAPDRLDVIASEARADLLRSFGVGLAGQLLFFPIMLVLCLLIVTWLVIPFVVLAVAIAIPVGYIAVARGLGEAVVDRKYELFDRFNLNRQNTYYYVLNGVLLLLLPFALAAVLQIFGGWLGFLRGLALFVGVVLAWAATTTGFGAVIITRGGGLMSDFRGFRRKRSVPLDDLMPETRKRAASSDADADAAGGNEAVDDA